MCCRWALFVYVAEAAPTGGKCTAVKAKATPPRPTPTKADPPQPTRTKREHEPEATPLRMPAPGAKQFPTATPSPPVRPPQLKRQSIRDVDMAAELEQLRKAGRFR